MGVPRGRRTKSKQGQRRSHLGLKKTVLAKCSHCGAVKRPHYVCQNCGFYGERPVIDVFKKLSKREKKAKEKELAEQKETEQTQAPPKDLSLEGLSRSK